MTGKITFSNMYKRRKESYEERVCMLMLQINRSESGPSFNHLVICRALSTTPPLQLPKPPHLSLAVHYTRIMAVPSNVPYPAGGTWFDTLKKSFVDVPVDASKDNAVPTTDFLEASESLTTLFGVETIISSVYKRSC